MPDRRYSDSETAEIFRAAAERVKVPARPTSSDDGLSLTQLQEIGREVGIPPEAVAHAAAALDVPQIAAVSSRRRFLGLPIGVSRSIDLNRRLSDAEWERLVARLREVFDAYGSTRGDGSTREWRNGNLRVMLVPTDSGHRLRFSTYNGSARGWIGLGMFALLTATAVAAGATLTGHLMAAAPGYGFLGFVGLGMIASGAIRLPGWARLRERQMEALAGEVASGSLPPSSEE